jgi:hypothetical protein
VTIGIGAICDHGRYIVLASDTRASFKGNDPNDVTGKQFDFTPLRLVASVAGRLGMCHDIVSEMTIRFDKLVKRYRSGKPIYREHIENAINESRIRQMGRRYDWAAKSQYKISANQLLTGKLPCGHMDERAWKEIKQNIFSLPLLAEIIVAGFLDDEPILLKASGKEYIEGVAEPTVCVIGSSGSRYAMDHLNKRGQNFASSFAQTALHIHEAMEIAKDKDDNGYIGECRGYVVLHRDKQGLSKLEHNCDLLKGWASAFANRDYTTPLKEGKCVMQVENMLTYQRPGPKFRGRKNLPDILN